MCRRFYSHYYCQSAVRWLFSVLVRLHSRTLVEQMFVKLNGLWFGLCSICFSVSLCLSILRQSLILSLEVSYAKCRIQPTKRSCSVWWRKEMCVFLLRMACDGFGIAVGIFWCMCRGGRHHFFMTWMSFCVEMINRGVLSFRLAGSPSVFLPDEWAGGPYKRGSVYIYIQREVRLVRQVCPRLTWSETTLHLARHPGIEPEFRRFGTIQRITGPLLLTCYYTHLSHKLHSGCNLVCIRG